MKLLGFFELWVDSLRVALSVCGEARLRGETEALALLGCVVVARGNKRTQILRDQFDCPCLRGPYNWVI